MDPYTLSPASVNGSAEETLLGILSRIQDVQNQPLVPQNPLAQLGSALSGFASGVQGQPNPALTLFQQQRHADISSLVSQGTIAGHVASLTERRREEEGRRRQQRLSLLGEFLKSDSGPARVFGASALQTELAKDGIQIPNTVVDALGQRRVKPAEMPEIMRMASSGVPDETILRSVPNLDPQTLADLKIASGSDAFRKSIGLPTKAEEESKVLQDRVRDLQAIRTETQLTNPEANEFVHRASKDLYGQPYFNLTEPQKKEARQKGAEYQLDLAYGQAAGRRMADRDVDLNAPLGEKAANWIDPKSYKPAKPGWLKSEVIAQGFVPVTDPMIRRNLAQIREARVTLESLEDLVRARPDIWPASTGSLTGDLVNVGIAKGKFWTSGNVDPDVAALKTLRTRVPALARLASEVGNLARLEQAVQSEGVGLDGPSTREAAISKISAMRRYLDTALGARDFSPLPAYTPKRRVTLKDGTSVFVPIGAQ